MGDAAQEAVAGFQPKAQDLDYPGKLQRLAEQPETATSAAGAAEKDTLLADTAVSNGDSSSLVSLLYHEEHLRQGVHTNLELRCLCP